MSIVLILYILENIIFWTFSSITRKILEYDMESWNKHISKLCKVTFIFQKFEKFQTRQKNWKGSYGFW